MPRLFYLAFVTLFFAASTGLAAAQAPATVGLQTVSSPNGYQYQVPSDWQTVPASLQERMGNQMFYVDGEVASSDGSQRAHVETATGFGISATNLSDALTAFFNAPVADGSGGSASVSVFAGPDPAQVPSADAAISGAATYSDASGAQRIVAARIAVKGQSTYLLAVDVTSDFYQSSPNFGQIMNSFKLAGSASASPQGASNP